MEQMLNLTDAELGIIDVVVSRFLSQRKATPRRQLVVRFQEPGLLETLVNRSLLRSLNTQDFLPTLLSFESCSDKGVLAFAKESVATVLHAMRALFLNNEEDRMFTIEEIETEAQALGRAVAPNTIWLGLYFAEEFSVLGGWAPGDNPAVKTSVRVSEWILKEKDIDNAWDNLVKQRIQWQVQRESYNAATSPQELEDDGDTFHIAADRIAMKETGLQVFISHSSKDGEIALGLIELLRSALPLKDEQVRCTSVDGFRLSAGANVNDDLQAEVLGARTFIGLITPNSLGSAYVLFELGARWGARRHMIPVLAGLAPSALQGPLTAINAISANNVNQLHQLVSDLADALDLDVHRAAAYTRYAEKLIRQIEDTFGIRDSSRKQLESKPQAEPADAGSGNSNQQGSERKLRALTRDTVIGASKYFRWNKQLPKWTVVVEGTAFPVRPLAFRAAGLLPNAPATTHQAVAKLKQLGFQVFYEGKPA